VDWQQRGLPCSINPALFHDDGEPERVKIAKQVVAKQICAGCHVQPECLAHALDHREDHGVWGGMTADERQNLLNKKVSR
jgi:WhiB family redox-sensing transcriptional regulator